jgi:uncharacterized protein
MSEQALTFGETLLAGTAAGAALSLREPLSFWGGFDAPSGGVIDRRHPECGQILSRKIILMTAARGSSSGSSVLAEAIRLGTAPAAFIVTERDAILVVGAMVAQELYGLSCPIVRVSPGELDRLRTAQHLTLNARPSGATISHSPR